jgi:maltose O-acetyltransferase
VEFAEGVTLEDYVRLIGSPTVKLGRDVYINSFCMMLGDIEVGDRAMISQFVNIWGRSHRFARRDEPIWVQHGPGGQGYKTGPIRIGPGAWIGPHVTVLRGVTIGEGAVVGANAVVTKDVPAFAVAMGAPARVRGFRGVMSPEGELRYDSDAEANQT